MQINDIKMVSFTPEKLMGLKKAYRQARDSHADVFTFDGDKYLVAYAEYVIVFVEAYLARPRENIIYNPSEEAYDQQRMDEGEL